MDLISAGLTAVGRPTSVTPPAGASPLMAVSPPTVMPQASGIVSVPGKAGVDAAAARRTAAAAGSGGSPTATPVNPAVIDTSPAAAQQTAATAALTSLLPVHRETSDDDTDQDAAAYVPFSVSPPSGEIAAGATAEILVKFLPLDVTEYFACLSARY